jgi:glycine oxidase
VDGSRLQRIPWFLMRRVAVVGAGIIGCSIAWRLRQRGLEVDVIEAGPLTGQASSAGAGMLAPGAEVCRQSAWSDLAVEGWRTYPQFVAELASLCAHPIDYRQCGAVEIALDTREWQDLQDRAAMQQQQWGVPSRPLESRELHAMVPALDAQVSGAMYYPRDAVVNPRDILAALLPLVKPVTASVSAIDASSEGVSLHSSAGLLKADAAILAAGAWSSSIAVRIPSGPYSLPVTEPVRGHLVGFPVEPGVLGPILRHHHTYLFQRRPAYLVAGASQERTGFDPAIDPEAVESIRQRAQALIPSLITGADYHPWTGFRPGPVGDAPVIGRVEDSRLWLAYGHFRNGILMAPATARLVTAELLAS